MGVRSFARKENTSQGDKKNTYLVIGYLSYLTFGSEINFVTVNLSYSGKTPPPQFRFFWVVNGRGGVECSLEPAGSQVPSTSIIQSGTFQGEVGR